MTTLAIEKTWQALHALAEPAFKESKTAQFVAEYLRNLGYKVQTGLTPSGTGVVATLASGKKGPVVGLRSDMDCLMFTENGKEVPVHACGHDGHMSMVLTAAATLAKKGLKKGKIKLVFQPAEEIGLGAKAMLSTGELEDLNYLFGVHLMPKNLAKSGQVAAKVNWQACTLLTVTITGLTAHGSMPHLGINALDTGCAIVNAVNAIHLDPLEGWSVKATRFNTGTGAINAICDHAEISFDLRTTLNSSMDAQRQKLYETCQALGVGISVMKAFGGGDLLDAELSPAGKALTAVQCISYALTRPAVATIMCGAHSVEQLRICASYENASEQEKDYATALASFPNISWKGHCMYCSHCAPCPKKIDVASVTKFLNLALAQNAVPETVRDHYNLLEHHAGECVQCGACEKRCPFAVKIIENMKKAKTIFGK